MLTDRLGLAPDAIPAGGNFYPEEDVLNLLVDEVERRGGCRIAALGGGVAVAVLACANARFGGGSVTAIEWDGRSVALTDALLNKIGVDALVHEAGLQEYDKHNLWYPRHSMGRLPATFDLLFVDGPGHFAGRMPRWPAGPELFHRLNPGGIVVLDDGKRVKEKKALKRWADDFPEFEQIKTGSSAGAVILRRTRDR